MSSRTARAIAAGARHAGEGAIGGRDEAPCKGDSFRLVAIEQGCMCSTVQDRGEFPGEVDRVTDTRVHALSADRAMNVRRVPEQKCSALGGIDRRHDDAPGKSRTS